MTNESTMIGGTVTVPASGTSLIKKEEMEDEVLMNEEEKMMDQDVVIDEEVTSVESAGEMEETMLTVALMQSVVDGKTKHKTHKRPRPATTVPNPLLKPIRPPPAVLLKRDGDGPVPCPLEDVGGAKQRRVNFEETNSATWSRPRGLSIDLDRKCTMH